jgi:hypothetical protein
MVWHMAGDFGLAKTLNQEDLASSVSDTHPTRLHMQFASAQWSKDSYTFSCPFSLPAVMAWCFYISMILNVEMEGA